ncbi:hypothetical protein CEXT_209781 [Caerostris extrusa]|uniref:Uncharacterized protein n=1 Tax=Caerostris extrusa TaxID=172846 RepID=A0AAV4WJ25_CAEEX|nr:hypothetical protein CEXT_209781 [Caerostris extrusa]
MSFHSYYGLLKKNNNLSHSTATVSLHVNIGDPYFWEIEKTRAYLRHFARKWTKRGNLAVYEAPNCDLPVETWSADSEGRFLLRGDGNDLPGIKGCRSVCQLH